MVATETHVEDLEARDIQDSNEVLALLLRVECLVTLLDEELEAAIEHGLRKGTHGVETLVLGATLCHELVADLDARFAQVLVEIRCRDSQQVSHSLSLLRPIGFRLLFAWSLLELEFTEVHDGSRDLVDVQLLLSIEAQDVEGFLSNFGIKSRVSSEAGFLVTHAKQSCTHQALKERRVSRHQRSATHIRVLELFSVIYTRDLYFSLRDVVVFPNIVSQE